MRTGDGKQLIKSKVRKASKHTKSNTEEKYVVWAIFYVFEACGFPAAMCRMCCNCCH